jgi:hypothetical protein
MLLSTTKANHSSPAACYFCLAPPREPLLLGSVVRTGFQFVSFALMAEEVNDFLRSVTGLGHNASLAETVNSFEPAFWPRGLRVQPVCGELLILAEGSDDGVEASSGGTSPVADWRAERNALDRL